MAREAAFAGVIRADAGLGDLRVRQADAAGLLRLRRCRYRLARRDRGGGARTASGAAGHQVAMRKPLPTASRTRGRRLSMSLPRATCHTVRARRSAGVRGNRGDCRRGLPQALGGLNSPSCRPAAHLRSSATAKAMAASVRAVDAPADEGITPCAWAWAWWRRSPAFLSSEAWSCVASRRSRSRARGTSLTPCAGLSRERT